MRLWFDGQCLQTASKLRGIGRYVQELIRGLATYQPGIELSVSFNAAMADEAIAAREVVRPWIKPENTHVWQGVSESGECIFGYTPKRQLSEIALAHHVAVLAPDIALSASPFEGRGDKAVPLLPIVRQNIPIGGIFYDAIPYRYPTKYLRNDFERKYYARRLAAHQKFDFLLAISEFSSDEAKNLIPGCKITTIHAGVSEDLLKLIEQQVPPPLRVGHRSSKKYILYVGAMDWRKNIPQVIHAFALLPQRLKEELQFIIAGNTERRHRKEVSDLWKHYKFPADNLKFLGHVSETALIELYANARAVIQPSLMEGFGLTALEAMSCGAPVIAAAAGALREVVGSPELLFNPEDARAMADCIARVCIDETAAERYVTHGLVQAKKYTWQRSAALAAAGLEEALTSKGATGTQTIAELRNLQLPAIRRISTDISLTSRVMAVGEPFQVHQNRLLVDITFTARFGGDAGIQRVVRKIAAGLLQEGVRQSDMVMIPVYCDGSDGFYKASVSADGRIDFDGKGENNKIFAGLGDIFLLLDASWDFYMHRIGIFRGVRLRGAKIITVIYDLIPMTASAFCLRNLPENYVNWLKAALIYSAGFICISKSLAGEFEHLLRTINFPKPMKIAYWHLGADFSCNRITACTRKFAAPSPVFLMVGTIEPRKGHHVALDAFEELWHTGFGGSLVIVGKTGWNMESIVARIRAHPEIGNRLHWFERVSDEQLQFLYGSCDCLIAASYVEGFGLPVIEAAAYGRPVIASDIAVFREVADEAQAIFFATGSSQALAASVRAWSQQRRQSGSEPKHGKSWITWIESARQLATVVVDNHWDRCYSPSADRSTSSTVEIGDVVMKRALTTSERRHRLELVQPPTLVEGGAALQIVVKLFNLSDVCWSSEGIAPESHAVLLGSRLLDRSGAHPLEGRPARIPFVVGPGGHLYLAVNVPSSWLDRGGKFVDIEMLQENSGWWGNPLKVALR